MDVAACGGQSLLGVYAGRSADVYAVEQSGIQHGIEVGEVGATQLLTGFFRTRLDRVADGCNVSAWGSLPDVHMALPHCTAADKADSNLFAHLRQILWIAQHFLR